MKRKFILYSMFVLFLCLTSCTPSAEKIAEPPTSTPTLTPTPVIPYDLTVSVLDKTGAPIPGASITFPESGNGTPVHTNDKGQYSWTNLRGEAVSLNISGQGYINAKQTVTIKRGPNEVKVTLQRDPFGILPAVACEAGQKVLYIEDFQDGQSQGWTEISDGISGNMPNGWTLLDESGNKILVHSNAPSPTGSVLGEHTFNNFVWHLRYKVIGKDADMFFLWRISNAEAGTKRYAVVVGAKGKPFMVRFSGGTAMNTASASSRLKEGQWYNFDVAYFDGTHQVWLDGKKIMEYKDPQPYPEGTIGFEEHLDQTKTTQFYMDNLVVCELTAPYKPPK